jgi:excisionase family DNA binding protein
VIVPSDIAEPVIALKDQYFDLKGLSAYSSLAVSTLREYLRRGRLPHFKMAGKILIRKGEFDSWLEQFRVSAPDVDTVAEEVLDSLKRHRIG